MLEDLKKCRDVRLVSDDELPSSAQSDAPPQSERAALSQSDAPPQSECAALSQADAPPQSGCAALSQAGAPPQSECAAPRGVEESPSASRCSPGVSPLAIPRGSIASIEASELFELEKQPRWHPVGRAFMQFLIPSMFFILGCACLLIDSHMQLIKSIHYIVCTVGAFQFVLAGLFIIHSLRPKWYMNIPPAPMSRRKFRIISALWLAPIVWIVGGYAAGVPMEDALRKQQALPHRLCRALAFIESSLSRRQAANHLSRMRDLAILKGKLSDAKELHLAAGRYAWRLPLTEEQVGDPLIYAALSHVRPARRLYAMGTWSSDQGDFSFERLMAARILDSKGEHGAADAIYDRYFRELSARSYSGTPHSHFMPITKERWERLTYKYSAEDAAALKKVLIVPDSEEKFGTMLADLRAIIYDLRPAHFKSEPDYSKGFALTATDVSVRLRMLPQAVREQNLKFADRLLTAKRGEWEALVNKVADNGPLPRGEYVDGAWRIIRPASWYGAALNDLMPPEFVIMTNDQYGVLLKAEEEMDKAHGIEPLSTESL